MEMYEVVKNYIRGKCRAGQLRRECEREGSIENDFWLVWHAVVVLLTGLGSVFIDARNINCLLQIEINMEKIFLVLEQLIIY